MREASAQVIPIRSKRAVRPAEGVKGLHPSAPFLHTLDLLMEDFGKRHDKEACVLCEPMKTLGRHRDEVAVELTESLFLTFFPDFEAYILEVKEGLVQGLLDRRDRSAYASWQDKLKALLQRQVQVDLGDFFNDIQKHLLKFAGIQFEGERREAILSQAMTRLEENWLWKAR